MDGAFLPETNTVPREWMAEFFKPYYQISFVHGSAVGVCIYLKKKYPKVLQWKLTTCNMPRIDEQGNELNKPEAK